MSANDVRHNEKVLHFCNLFVEPATLLSLRQLHLLVNHFGDPVFQNNLVLRSFGSNVLADILFKGLFDFSLSLTAGLGFCFDQLVPLDVHQGALLIDLNLYAFNVAL